MYISQETAEQTDRRLRKVMAATDLQVLEGDWWFEEFPLSELGARMRADAVALIRFDCSMPLKGKSAERHKRKSGVKTRARKRPKIS